MNYRVIVSEQAESDLKDIYSYICNDLKSEKSADKVVLRLQNIMTSLSATPECFRVYPVEPWMSRKIRFVPVDNYIVFYLVKDADGEVWIPRIVYGKRDIKNIL